MKVVLQCLYAQCQTAHFGAALHHTLATCSNLESDALGALPQLIRHQGLRKRQGPRNTESAFLTRSVNVVQSAIQTPFSRLIVTTTTGGIAPVTTGQSSGLSASGTVSAFNGTFHPQASNGAARLRIGR